MHFNPPCSRDPTGLFRQRRAGMNRAQSCSGLNPPPKAAAQEFEENRPPPRNPASFPQSSHDPNSRRQHRSLPPRSRLPTSRELQDLPPESARPPESRDRKSTRLNSNH